jgi:RNA polymerase sigma-70 factor (ECF subfamily)
MTQIPPDEALVDRARGGDRDAFDALIRRSQPRLANLVRARMGGELRQVEESGDLVQTALAAAVRDLPAFTPDGEGSFLRWLAAVVENKIRHRLRDLKRQCRDPARAEPASAALADRAGSEPGPSSRAAEHETEARYRAALERLEPVDREVVLLHVDLGWTYQDIAGALGQASAEAVRKRVTRAVARLGLLMGSPPP